MFDYVWNLEGHLRQEVLVRLGGKSVEEILMAGCSQPLGVTDMRAKLHEVVTASDASETGGGSVYGSKLTSRLREMRALEEEEDEPQSALVFESEG